MAVSRLVGHLVKVNRCPLSGIRLASVSQSGVRLASAARAFPSSRLRTLSSVASGVNPVRFQGQDLPPSPDVIIRPPPGYVELEKVKKDGSTIRFYVDVGVSPVDETAHPDAKGQWAVKLGGKYVLTPKRNLFAVPSEALAYAIAQEWDAQIEKIKPTSMPLMKLATSAIDMAEEARPRMFEDLRKNANNDNCCVRAPGPHTLVKLQRKHHDPLLKWASEKHGIDLELIETVFPKRQPRATMQKVEEILNSMDKWTLSAFDFMAATTKSFIIPLAVLDYKLTINEAVAASRTEENFQSSLYGEIRDAHGLDEAYVRLTVAAARVFLCLLRGVPTAEGKVPTTPQIKV